MIRKCRVFILLLMLFFDAGKLFAEGFPAGTLVKVPTNNNGFCYVAIEDLKVGDWVYGVDDKQQERLTLISATTNREISSSFLLEFESGQELTSDAGQKFYVTDKGWTEVVNLKIGDQINNSRIYKITHQLRSYTKLYALSVAGVHTYRVTRDELTAHNFILEINFLSIAFGGGETVVAFFSAEKIVNALLAFGLFWAAEKYHPGSTAGVTYSAKGNMYQFAGKGSERGNMWEGNVDEKCSQVPTLKERMREEGERLAEENRRSTLAQAKRDFEEKREREAQEARARREQAYIETGNKSFLKKTCDWFTHAPRWWGKKLFGEQKPPEPLLKLETTPHYLEPVVLPNQPLLEQAVTELYQQFEAEHPDAALDFLATPEHVFGQEELNPKFKEYLVQQSYEMLYQLDQHDSPEQRQARLNLAEALTSLHNYELEHHPDEALLQGYQTLANSLALQVMSDSMDDTDELASQRAVVLSDLCNVLCDENYLDDAFNFDPIPLVTMEELWDDVAQLDRLEQIAQLEAALNQQEVAGSSQQSVPKKILNRTSEILLERVQDIYNDPLPFLGNITLCVVAPELALVYLIIELAPHCSEIFEHAATFKRLLQEDTPEAVAQIAALCVETIVLSKGISAAQHATKLARCARTAEGIAALVTEEQAAAKAAKAAGKKIETPTSNMMKNAAQAVVTVQEEGIEAARRQLPEALQKSTTKSVYKAQEPTVHRVDIPPTSLANKIEITRRQMAIAEELEGGIQRNLGASEPKRKTRSHTTSFSATQNEFKAIAEDFREGLEKKILYSTDGIEYGWKTVSIFDHSAPDYVLETEKVVRYPDSKASNLYGRKSVGNIEIIKTYHPKEGAAFVKNSFRQNLHVLIED